MKRTILAFGLAALSLVSASACTAQASSTEQKAKPEAQAGQPAEAKKELVKHIDAAFMRANIYDYKAHPTKFVFKGKRPAVVDFYATWCGPCRSLGPKLEAVAKKYEGKIDFYKVDVDKNAELSQIFRVQSIPMVLFIPMEGIPTQTLGDLSPEEIQQSIDLIYKAAK